MVRKIRRKFRLRDLENKLGYSKQYINNVQEITIKPNKDFLSKLDLILDKEKQW